MPGTNRGTVSRVKNIGKQYPLTFVRDRRLMKAMWDLDRKRSKDDLGNAEQARRKPSV